MTCAIGKGSNIQPVVESDRVALILEASQRFGDVQFRDRLVGLMLDPKTSMAVRGLHAPTNGFPNAVEFRTWLEREREYFEDVVTMYQKR